MAGIEQREAARLAGLSLRTITNAEGGQCGRASWDKLIALYQDAGLRLVSMPTIDGNYIAMIQIAPDACQLGDIINPE